MYDNLYCKIYLDSGVTREVLHQLIMELISGEPMPFYGIKTPWCSIDVRKNKEYHEKILQQTPEDFIFWKYYLDIEPEQVEEKAYIMGIVRLIKGLREKGMKVIPSCDFEECF